MLSRLSARLCFKSSVSAIEKFAYKQVKYKNYYTRNFSTTEPSERVENKYKINLKGLGYFAISFFTYVSLFEAFGIEEEYLVTPLGIFNVYMIKINKIYSFWSRSFYISYLT